MSGQEPARTGPGAWLLAAIAGAVVVPVLALGSCGVVFAAQDQIEQDCQQTTTGGSGSAVVVDVEATVDHSDLGGTYLSSDASVRLEQLRNAGYIMNAAAVLGMSTQAQQVGVMTALGESGLRVIDYGDAVGPDSRGLFQQRANGAWGSYSDRMDPTISATNFFTALNRVSGWELMSATAAAHAVQRNADPSYYAKFEQASVAIVAALSGTTSDTDGASGCATSGSVTADGWVRPVAATRITSPFGMRVHPITGAYKLHAGTDLGAACKTPIYAAAAGTVIAANGAGTSTQKDLVRIDNGGGVNTLYMHMYPEGIFVQPGDVVTAGELIAEVGSAGSSTACHLHFEVRVDGEATDPVPFMQARGVTLP